MRAASGPVWTRTDEKSSPPKASLIREATPASRGSPGPSRAIIVAADGGPPSSWSAPPWPAASSSAEMSPPAIQAATPALTRSQIGWMYARALAGRDTRE